MHSTPADHPPESWERDQSRYEIGQAIDAALAATNRKDGLPAGGYEMRLAALLDRYAGRRTIEARMVRDVAELAVGRVSEVKINHDRYVAGLVDAHAAEEARLRDVAASLQVELDRLRDQLAAGQQLAESRHGFGDDKVVCTFRNGSNFRIWSPALLEEVAFRVRAGGGDDDHAIHVRVPDNEKDGRVEFVAHLPNPDLVSFDLSTPQRPSARAVAPTAPAAAKGSPPAWAQWWPPSRSPVLTTAAAFVVGLLLAVAVTLGVLR